MSEVADAWLLLLESGAFADNELDARGAVAVPETEMLQGRQSSTYRHIKPLCPRPSAFMSSPLHASKPESRHGLNYHVCSLPFYLANQFHIPHEGRLFLAYVHLSLFMRLCLLLEIPIVFHLANDGLQQLG